MALRIKLATGILLFWAITLKCFGQKFEKLALTPPMGWNSWNRFGCDVNERMIRDMADAMVATGLKDAGYEYIVIDDCWHGERDSLGFIHANPEHFPSGIKALTDYVHSKGLKFGIYSCAGYKTCAGRPAGRGHEYQDALMYARWGVDYLKYDWCNTEGLNTEGAYMTMRDALYNAGRPIVFSLCEWGNSKPWLWGEKVGHLWRTTGDVYDCFDCKFDHGGYFSWGVLQILDMQKDIRQYAGPGHWNDPDMMEVGNNGLTVNESRAHFTMWCMLAAPLMAGNDITKMTPETKNILINKEVIAIDQDSLGIQGLKYSIKDSVEIWFKPLKNDAWAVVFLNRTTKPVSIQFDWKANIVNDDFSKRKFDANVMNYQLRDVWAKQELGNTTKALNVQVQGRDVLALVLKKEEKTKKK